MATTTTTTTTRRPLPPAPTPGARTARSGRGEDRDEGFAMDEAGRLVVRDEEEGGGGGGKRKRGTGGKDYDSDDSDYEDLKDIAGARGGCESFSFVCCVALC